MKIFYSFLTCLFLSTFLFSCGGNNGDAPVIPDEPEGPTIIQGINALVNPSASFAKDDGSTTYDSPAKLVANLLTKAGPEIIKGLGYITITDKELLVSDKNRLT